MRHVVSSGALEPSGRRWSSLGVAATCVSLGGCCLGGGTGGSTTGPATIPTERRELHRASIDGIEIALGAELHAWSVAGHAGPEYRWVEGRDFLAIFESVAPSRGGAPVALYDTSALPPEIPPTPTSLDGARARLAGLSVVTCPVEHGLAYRLGDRWAVLWTLGDRLFRAAPPLEGASCEGLVVPPRDAWLSTHPYGATTCLALDDAGSREAAITCMAQGVDVDVLPAEPLPAEGPPSDALRALPRADRDVMRARIDGDDAARAAYVERLLAIEDEGDPATVAARVQVLSAPHRLELAARIARDCADPSRPCTAAALQLHDLATRVERGAPSEATCEAVSALAQAVRARAEPEPLRRVLLVVRGNYPCDTPALRALALEALGTATSPDVPLRSSDATAYELVDGDCRPYEHEGARRVGPLCASYPRWAGSWLAGRCGPDAVARAQEVLATRPREPFDPREDQIIDGALRVLGACDAAAFEAAIAHLPENAPAMADCRSRQALGRLFLTATR